MEMGAIHLTCQRLYQKGIMIHLGPFKYEGILLTHAFLLQHEVLAGPKWQVQAVLSDSVYCS